jgi:hypothetical protein
MSRAHGKFADKLVKLHKSDFERTFKQCHFVNSEEGPYHYVILKDPCFEHESILIAIYKDSFKFRCTETQREFEIAIKRTHHKF